MRAMRGVKHACVGRNRLGFYSCVSCVHALRRFVNRALEKRHLVTFLFRYSVLISCWRSNPDNRKTFSELCNIMDTQLNSMSDYLDLNVIANTSFNVSTENLYTVADIDTGEYGRAAAGGRGVPHYVMEVPQADTWAYDDVANDEVHDARSVDELYKKASEDDDKSLNI